ncbi:hypothetical protein [Moorena sp. SIO3A2]|uniref:hypothetical protein n=1 Tax=Moorena sp. SIO3A2 TaxID=2607841 RepID=UPI0013B6DCE4|nr:hypothetical protein [Moorena sp. SIO3A2]NER90331.1 hypothetical protein [Moorena sp. SIO3A2]
MKTSTLLKVILWISYGLSLGCSLAVLTAIPKMESLTWKIALGASSLYGLGATGKMMIESAKKGHFEL